MTRSSASDPWGAWDALRRPIWLFDPTARRGVYANKAALALWGAASLDELLARDFSALSPAVLTRLERLAGATRDGQEVTERWTFYPNGHPVTVQAVISAYPLPGQRDVLLFEAAPVDAEDEERRALEALRHTSTLISLFDTNGASVFVNPAAFAAYGVSDLPLSARFAEPDRAEALLARAGAGQPIAMLCEVVTRHGPRWHHLDARSGLDPVTGADSLLLSERDVTETVEAHTARAAAERRAADEEARRLLLTELSHELRTPLNAVLGFADLLCRSRLDPEPADQAARIRDGGQRLLAVVNQMIRVSDGTACALEPLTSAPEPIPADIRPRDRPPRVLYVDDNEANRRLVMTVLQSQGLDCEIAHDGAEGLAAFQSGDWDVVLMDIQMPVMDGVAATRAIRALDDTRAQIPIIAVTANTLGTQLETYAAAGMNDWIEKPVDMAVLIHKTTAWAASDWRSAIPAADATAA